MKLSEHLWNNDIKFFLLIHDVVIFKILTGEYLINNIVSVHAVHRESAYSPHTHRRLDSFPYRPLQED